MKYCTCSECEFCFPHDLGFVCAGGSDDEKFYKNYGDIIKREEIFEAHNCDGFHQGLGYYLSKIFRQNP